MKVYIANFGRQNYEWPVCRTRGTVATMNSVSVQRYWETGNKEAYVAYLMANDLTAAGVKPTKSTVSRWYNLMTIVSETAGDIWIHRDGDQIWWTKSNSEPPQFETKKEPIDRGREVVVCHKPCEGWSDRNRLGHPLRWNELHPKAKDFLSTEATLQSLSPDYRDYTLDLIEGNDLHVWHSSPAWVSKAGLSKQGYTPVKYATQVQKVAYQRAFELFSSVDPYEKAAARMARSAVRTTEASYGQVVERVIKRKELEFSNAASLQDYIVELMEAQEGVCELTGLPIELDETNGDPAFFASLDRIDSNGHYGKGNLQVVCRFANFWKGASKNEDFKRLIEVVKASVA